METPDGELSDEIGGEQLLEDMYMIQEEFVGGSSFWPHVDVGRLLSHIVAKAQVISDSLPPDYPLTEGKDRCPHYRRERRRTALRRLVHVRFQQAVVMTGRRPNSPSKPVSTRTRIWSALILLAVFLLGLVWHPARLGATGMLGLAGFPLFWTGGFIARMAEASGEEGSPTITRVTAVGNARMAAGVFCIIGAAFLCVLLENQ